MPRVVTTLAAGAVLFAACGQGTPRQHAAAGPGPSSPAAEPRVEQSRPGASAAGAPRGTSITAARSRFGRMRFDSREQAISIFENDRRGKSVCYGRCARAWPPVLTTGAPRARDGAGASLLGTIRRRAGARQVTYAGKPLYFYAHEDPAQVLCHNVDLNGGLWWVIGPNGRRRP